MPYLTMIFSGLTLDHPLYGWSHTTRGIEYHLSMELDEFSTPIYSGPDAEPEPSISKQKAHMRAVVESLGGKQPVARRTAPRKAKYKATRK